MKPHADLTPYPILLASGDDYVGASFHSDVSIQPVSDKYVIDCTFTLDEPTLQHLIANGSAEFVTHIECPRTSFRTIIRTQDPLKQVVIPSDAVSGFLEVCTYIVCTSPVSGFSSPKFHPDYTQLTFDLETGSILGIAESCRVELDDEDTNESSPSIVRIARAQPTQVDDMTVNTDSEYIYITLAPELYDRYHRTSKGFLSEAVATSIVLPALMMALLRLRENEDQDVLWARILRDWCRANSVEVNELDITSIEGQSVLSVAQRMLENPLGRALASIEEADPLNAD